MLRHIRVLYPMKVALSALSSGRRAQVAPGPAARRALEWQRVDALLESLRRLEIQGQSDLYR
jgi:hypothetical protein